MFLALVGARPIWRICFSMVETCNNAAGTYVSELSSCEPPFCQVHSCKFPQELVIPTQRVVRPGGEQVQRRPLIEPWSARLEPTCRGVAQSHSPSCQWTAWHDPCQRKETELSQHTTSGSERLARKGGVGGVGGGSCIPGRTCAERMTEVNSWKLFWWSRGHGGSLYISISSV